MCYAISSNVNKSEISSWSTSNSEANSPDNSDGNSSIFPLTAIFLFSGNTQGLIKPGYHRQAIVHSAISKITSIIIRRVRPLEEERCSVFEAYC